MQSTERWLPVLGFEGMYEVSDHGRVRSLDRVVYAGRGRTRLQNGRIVALNTHVGGYRLAHLYKDNARTAKLVHRLVLESFGGDRPDGTEVCHNDGNPGNNALSNLRWDTHTENVRDTYRHGTAFPLTKTHCPHGHLLSAPNLAVADLRAGRRRCLACTRAQKTKSEPFSKNLADRRYAAIMQS